MSSLDKFEIDCAVRQERFYRDTAQWEKLREMWHPDPAETLIDISWITGSIDQWIRGCIGMQEAGNFNSFHTMQPAEILICGERAIATSTICINGRTSLQECDVDLESWAHQVQRLVKVEASWKFVRFEAIYLRDRISSAYPAQKIPPLDDRAAEVLRMARPSFKHLALQMHMIGKTVRNNLPGYDDEDTWRPLVKRNLVWLSAGNLSD